MGDKEMEETAAPRVGETAAGSRAQGEGSAEQGRPTGLDQIREILFGASYRELERRLVRTSSHFAARAQQLEQGTRRRTEVLEAHLQKEIETLTTRQERGFVETDDTLRELGREYREGLAKLEHRVAKVEEASARGLRELRNELLEQAKSFLDELQRLRQELLAMLRQELDLSEGEIVEEQGEADMEARH